MRIGGQGQLLDIPVGKLYQAVGVVGEPQVFAVTPGALGGRTSQSREGQSLLRGRRRRR